MSDAAKFDDTPDFSLVLGGPLYQLFLRLRMAKPPLDLLTRRMIIMPLIAWLPLLLMSALGGQVVGGRLAGYVAFGHAAGPEGSLGSCDSVEHSFTLRVR